MNHHLETDVINTEGYAYGVEFQVKKPAGKLNGWMSYTYSRTFLRQNDPRIARPINGGEWYPTEYDKPHDFKLVGNYKFTRRYSMSFNMDYSTGRPTTIPAGQYYDQGLKKMQVYYTDRNSYRVPDYFRMDLSFNIEPSHHLTLLTHSSLSFRYLYLTGRKNVYSVYFVSEEGRIQGYKMSIFGAPIPFVTYNIKFWKGMKNKVYWWYVYVRYGCSLVIVWDKFNAHLPESSIGLLIVEGSIISDSAVVFSLSRSFSLDVEGVPPDFNKVDAEVCVTGEDGSSF